MSATALIVVGALSRRIDAESAPMAKTAAFRFRKQHIDVFY
jgi:hypothetical protein